MGHLLQGTAFLRWSVLRFRHCDGQFRYMTLPRSAFPVLLERVVGRPKFGSGKNGCVAARAVFFEPLGKERGGGVDGFRRFTSRGSQFHQVACVFEGDGSGEDLDVESDDEEEEEEDDGRVYEAGDDYIVVNFYHFVDIEDAHLEVARHSAFVEVRQTSSLSGRCTCDNSAMTLIFVVICLETWTAVYVSGYVFVLWKAVTDDGIGCRVAIFEGAYTSIIKASMRRFSLYPCE